MTHAKPNVNKEKAYPSLNTFSVIINTSMLTNAVTNWDWLEEQPQAMLRATWLTLKVNCGVKQDMQPCATLDNTNHCKMDGFATTKRNLSILPCNIFQVAK